MKKTYLQPQFEIVNIKLGASILEGSLEKRNETVDGIDGGWVHQDEYEDEYYY